MAPPHIRMAYLAAHSLIARLRGEIAPLRFLVAVVSAP